MPDHPPGSVGPSALVILCTLRGSDPVIWRRIEVAATASLTSLHATLQAVMCWEDDHLWEFRCQGRRYGPDAGFRPAVLPFQRRPALSDPDHARIGRMFSAVGDTIAYAYDFGDGWEVELCLEARQESLPDVVYPRCIAGGMAAPPEDIGGLPGFQRLKQAIADPQDPEHEHYLDWIPEGWRADVCDMSWIAENLESLWDEDDDRCWPDEATAAEEDAEHAQWLQAQEEAEAAQLAEVVELRIRPDQMALLRELLAETPTADPAPGAALDAAAPHRKGSVVRGTRRVWNTYVDLLDEAAESPVFLRAKQSRELRALISQTR